MPIIARDPQPKDPRSDKWIAEASRIITGLDDDELTEWELDFVEDLETKWIPGGRITERQIETLRKIADPELRREYEDY